MIVLIVGAELDDSIEAHSIVFKVVRRGAASYPLPDA
jgi:hypothetical protein